MKKVGDAHRKGLSVIDACSQCYSGAFPLETVPSVILIAVYCRDNLEEAIIRAINDTKNNDTIAAIVGALLGDCTAKRRSRREGCLTY